MIRTDIIKKSDSTHVKRSKFIAAGIKPIENKESLLWGLVLDYAKKHFLIHLKDFSLEDLFFKKEESKKILDLYKSIFGNELNIEDEYLKIESLTVNFLREHEVFIKSEFETLITEELNSKEFKLLPNVYRFYISKELVKFEYKDFYQHFLKYCIENTYVKDFLAISEWAIKERDTVKTRDLNNLMSCLNLLNIKEKTIIKNEYLKFFKDFEEYCFFEEIDITDLEKSQFLIKINSFE